MYVKSAEKFLLDKGRQMQNKPSRNKKKKERRKKTWNQTRCNFEKVSLWWIEYVLHQFHFANDVTTEDWLEVESYGLS